MGILALWVRPSNMIKQSGYRDLRLNGWQYFEDKPLGRYEKYGGL